MSPDLPTDAGESTPGQTILLFQVLSSARLTRPTQRVLCPRWMSARASQPDNLTISSPKLGEAYPSNTAGIVPPLDVGESLPARQTYLSSLTLGEAYPSNTAGIVPPLDVGESLPARQTYLSSLTLGEAYPSNTAGIVPPLDVGESLPARQTHPFRLLAPRYRTPSNATCPAVQAILAFSPLPARFNRPTHEY